MIRHSTWNRLTPTLAHDLLRLRVDVFVVEQRCAYPEIDGRDLEPSAVQVWHEAGDSPGTVTGCLRLLTDGAERRIGRVCVAPSARGTGVASELVTAALELCGDAVVVLDAQSPLVAWYGRHGFAVAGAEFLEDGILHTPMRRS